MKDHGQSKKKKRLAVPIMIQGTASSAGKSLITAALCRIFSQDGYKAAPFKAQNMALNSGVTPDGLEIGRAQITQARAANIPIDSRLNPVLLKPTGEKESQVIVNGKVFARMSAREYFKFRRSLLPTIAKSYYSLARDYDIIVIEGAGSPAEINLKKDDIANMGIARLVNAPVLLAGDIDKGGVFASLYGTVSLLPRSERKLIKGLLINKFRGDVKLLKGGLRQIKELTGIPVLGVIPYIENLTIEDEDSVSDLVSNTLAAQKFSAVNPSQRGNRLHVSAARLPYMSNFTDMNALSRLPFVDVTFFGSEQEYKDCEAVYGKTDLLILPGTKNTMRALKTLKKTGLFDFIRSIEQTTPVIGICGGYQLMAEVIKDEHAREDGKHASIEKGLALLETCVIFKKKKTRCNTITVIPQMEGFFSFLSGLPVKGYEIHSGQTLFFPYGYRKFAAKGNSFGTYLHGFFESRLALTAIIGALFSAKNLPAPPIPESSVNIEKEYNRLADTVRASLNLDAIYDILKERGLKKEPHR